MHVAPIMMGLYFGGVPISPGERELVNPAARFIAGNILKASVCCLLATKILVRRTELIAFATIALEQWARQDVRRRRFTKPSWSCHDPQ
jgi:hypothetical protein